MTTSNSLIGPKTVKFYSKGTQHGEFSNLFLRETCYDFRLWKSVEHAYQYHKIAPEYKDIAEWIITAPRPSAVAIAGHGFTPYKKYVRKNWDTFKVELMRDLVYAKFSQHDDLMKKLVETGDAILVEDSPHDSFWGCGKDGKGVNMLGKILMETREKLVKEQKDVEKFLNSLGITLADTKRFTRDKIGYKSLEYDNLDECIGCKKETWVSGGTASCAICDRMITKTSHVLVRPGENS